MATTTDSMLYPKITNHIADIVKVLRKLNHDLRDPENVAKLDPIPIIGTTKLHGTHADIVIHKDNEIAFQSRNVSNLSRSKDNLDFYAIMSKKSASLLRLRDLYIARWKHLNPSAILDETHPLIIAGEWIGEKIQNKVAICQLSRRFAIISVSINRTWQKDSDYSAISLPNHDIYHVSRAGVFNATLYPDDIPRTVATLDPLAEQVAAKCPFAASFNINGPGEGIVWKPAAPAYAANPALWFKTKGGPFKPTFARPPKKTMSFDTIAENRRVAAEVAIVWCSEPRLEQSWDVLREVGTVRNMKALTPFLKWIQGDILVEEGGYIKEHGVDEGALKIEIAKIAKAWYLARLDGSR